MVHFVHRVELGQQLHGVAAHGPAHALMAQPVTLAELAQASSCSAFSKHLVWGDVDQLPALLA
jgi:hypothetical protein